jgi:Spy/CpxP family protein refolding chaperone
MKGTKRIVTTLATAIALAFAASAAAHPGYGSGPGNGPGPGSGGQGGYCGGGPGAGSGSPVAASEGRLAYLKAELKITAAQEGAWAAFAANARVNAQGMQAHRDAMFQGTGAAPDRFAQRAQFMKERAAGMEAAAAVLKDLYAVLTPDQKAIADGLFARGGRGHGRFAFGG